MDEITKIINATVDGIYLSDQEGIIVKANQTWLRHIRMTEEQVLGRHVTDVLRDYYFSAQCLNENKAVWTMREGEYEQSVTVRALREGRRVGDFYEEGRLFSIATPIRNDHDEMEFVLTQVRDVTKLADGYDAIEHAQIQPQPSDMIGQSPEMERIRVLIHEVAPTNATILITGETGVGKEVVASEIHSHSARSGQPYLKINCAAIPESLVEAELFGYEAGAFTGAQKKGKEGLLAAANQGTVLLDEIGEIPLSLQPKLLRAIQERVIMRVGGVEPIPIDIRILAATNQNLAELVAQKRFREDLYYRLNVIPISLPPLRSRGSDIDLLAESFLAQFNECYCRGKILTSGARQVIRQYAWPGNIRELRNLMERLVVLGNEREISAAKAQLFLNTQLDGERPDEATLTLQEATNRLQANLIEAALLRYGSTYKTARALGTSQSTLIRKARQFGIPTAPRS